MSEEIRGLTIDEWTERVDLLMKDRIGCCVSDLVGDWNWAEMWKRGTTPTEAMTELGGEIAKAIEVLEVMSDEISRTG